MLLLQDAIVLCYLQLLLIHNGADINAMDSDCNTPLHIACSHGHDVVVKSLLFSTVKCKINAVNHEENTPLHNAAKWGFGGCAVCSVSSVFMYCTPTA